MKDKRQRQLMKVALEIEDDMQEMGIVSSIDLVEEVRTNFDELEKKISCISGKMGLLFKGTGDRPALLSLFLSGIIEVKSGSTYINPKEVWDNE